MKQYNSIYLKFVSELMGEESDQEKPKSKSELIKISKYKKAVSEITIYIF